MLQKTINIIGHNMLLTADGNTLSSCRWLISPNDANDQADESSLLTQAAREIEEYFEGTRREFTVPIAPKGTEFQMKVWAELRRIPYGETITYAELARRIGSPTSFRAVANACGKNPFPVVIPCHRVVGSNGKPGGYTGGLDIKQALQDIEQHHRPAAQKKLKTDN